jgi:ketosteroid isomerase-like protein
MQFFTASQSGDADAWAAAFAADGVFHDPIGQPPIESTGVGVPSARCGSIWP